MLHKVIKEKKRSSHELIETCFKKIQRLLWKKGNSFFTKKREEMGDIIEIKTVMDSKSAWADLRDATQLKWLRLRIGISMEAACLVLTKLLLTYVDRDPHPYPDNYAAPTSTVQLVEVSMAFPSFHFLVCPCSHMLDKQDLNISYLRYKRSCLPQSIVSQDTFF